jgi:type II secretory pathway component PulF
VLATFSPADRADIAEPVMESDNDDVRRQTVQRSRVLGVSSTSVLLVLNQLAVMSQNGIEIVESLEMVRDNCPDARLGASLDEIHDAVNGGHTLSSAVATYGEYFPPTLAPMLAAAESTGRVPETLKRVCERMRGELAMRGQVIGALVYPVILMGAAATVMSALIVGVLPQFSKVFASMGKPVPPSTQYLLTFGGFCREYWMFILPVLVGIVAGLLMLRRNPIVQGPMYKFLMFGPLIRDAYRPLAAGRNFRTIAAMVSGGVPLLQAVRLTRNTTRDVYWQQLWSDVEDTLIEGERASDAFFEVDFIPPEAAQMVATAEKTGRIGEVLEDIGTFYEEEASRKIKRLVVALEPVIILVMGVIVAGVVMSVMLPLLDVSTISS